MNTLLIKQEVHCRGDVFPHCQLVVITMLNSFLKKLNSCHHSLNYIVEVVNYLNTQLSTFI